jgi:hypothetical protein
MARCSKYKRLKEVDFDAIKVEPRRVLCRARCPRMPCRANFSQFGSPGDEVIVRCPVCIRDIRVVLGESV